MRLIGRNQRSRKIDCTIDGDTLGFRSFDGYGSSGNLVAAATASTTTAATAGATLLAIPAARKNNETEEKDYSSMTERAMCHFFESLKNPLKLCNPCCYESSAGSEPDALLYTPEAGQWLLPPPGKGVTTRSLIR